MKFQKFGLIAFMAISLWSCGDNTDKDNGLLPPSETEEPGNDTPSGNEPIATSRDEQYRPQIHFTPASNWMNDPNGMVYADGIWHLYYQYNPAGKQWGNMSWGHAVSKDLVHWEEKPVAMMRNQWGDIFSGSAIVDKDNVAGYGKDAIIAFYTASGERQQQCMAYSTDGGLTFTQYDKNPVLKNTEFGGFRDPKVFYHNESGKWIMTTTRSVSDGDYNAFRIVFFSSEDLKNWDYLSEFNNETIRVKKGQWECPDLVKVPYHGCEKWVLIISSNPGGPMGGSGTMYFPGNFDGTTFTADEREYPLWLDFGPDNYAGVTWNNAPDGRVIMIGWMNNWMYAGAVPVAPWTSAMTLPRELTLTDINGEPYLSTKVVSELNTIAGEWKKAENGIAAGGQAYEFKVKVKLEGNTTMQIANGNGEYMELQVRPAAQSMLVKRTSSTGVVNFSSSFSLPSITAPLNTEGEEMELHIYVDRSSVEVINAEGTSAITCLVFPSVPYDRITGADDVEYRPLNSIW